MFSSTPRFFAEGLRGHLAIPLVVLVALGTVSCAPNEEKVGSDRPTPLTGSSVGSQQPSNATIEPTAKETHVLPPTQQPNEATEEPRDVPVGFPLAPTLRPSRVIERAQGRAVVPAQADGPTVLEVARDYQALEKNDFEANQFGWNCRLHQQYEGAPAVDWYLPKGTAVRATMAGQAELFIITTLNSFEHYQVDPMLYLGLPSPSLPRYPFPGPSGGMGIFVSVLNGSLRAEYGHLDLRPTLDLVPQGAFLPSYGRGYSYEAQFNRPLNPDQGTLVARWPVRKGQTIGFVGNSGYSDVPHLHYQIVTSDRNRKFCPTEEDFPNAGWLFRKPAMPP